MLTEQEVREKSARWMWVVLPVMTCALGAVFLYLIGMGSFREPLASQVGNRFGETARDMTEVALIFPAFVILVLPSGLAIRYAGRFRTVCPLCDQDISSGTDRVLATRCCPSCDERILDGGRAHSAAVYKRYQALQSRHVLTYWLWTWPALGGVAIAWQWFDRSAVQECPNSLWFPPLIGIATAGWAWLRTWDRRYVPQLLASVVLFGLGAVVFWRAFWPV